MPPPRYDTARHTTYAVAAVPCTYSTVQYSTIRAASSLVVCSIALAARQSLLCSAVRYLLDRGGGLHPLPVTVSRAVVQQFNCARASDVLYAPWSLLGHWCGLPGCIFHSTPRRPATRRCVTLAVCHCIASPLQRVVSHRCSHSRVFMLPGETAAERRGTCRAARTGLSTMLALRCELRQLSSEPFDSGRS